MRLPAINQYTTTLYDIGCAYEYDDGTPYAYDVDVGDGDVGKMMTKMMALMVTMIMLGDL